MRTLHFPFRDGRATSEKGWVEPPGDGDVVRLLNRYADSLSPNPHSANRMRAGLMMAFRESAAGRGEAAADVETPGRDWVAVPSVVGPTAKPARGRQLQWTRRRFAAAVCAFAILTLSTVGIATAESGPGQPFYRLRLGLEAVNLPPAGSNTRLAADLGRADARLDDVAAATSRSDWNGAADAADAYREVVASVVLPDDASSRQGAIARLTAELTRLEGLRAGSHPPETARIDTAVATLAGLLGVPIPALAPAADDSPAGPGAPLESESDTSSEEAAEGSNSSGSGGSSRGGAHESSQPGDSSGPDASDGHRGAGQSDGPDAGGNRNGGRPTPSATDGGRGWPNPSASSSPGWRFPGPDQSPWPGDN